MSTEHPSGCAEPERVEALARGDLAGPELARAQRLLESSRDCREYFRGLTAGLYPDLPNYTVVEQVGTGGFGVVYKAIHHTKERTEAVKVLFSKTPLITSYFQNEVHLIARLRHPNIATLFEAHLDAPPLYYAMEFVEGQRLNDYLRTRPVPLAERITLLRTVALALEYAHAQGVLHRDIKPQNIIVDAAGQPHLVDFGIAKRLELAEDAARRGGAAEPDPGPVGTLGYISPEQIRGDPLDARADIYSLGALLFYVVTGEPARQAKDSARCRKLLRQRRVSEPEALAAIIARCVEDAPADRYGSCAALVADLGNYLEGRAVAARVNPSWLERGARIAALLNRNYPIALRVAVLVLVALGLGYVFLELESRSRTWAVDSDNTRIISFNSETREAIQSGRLAGLAPGLDARNPKSWRVLHGALLEKLSEAYPLVVTLDYYFPDEQPRYDAALIRGIRAVRCPVIVGANKFDVNGEPKLAASIREAVHGYGTLAGAKPDSHANEYEIPGAMQRGFETPIPGLAVAAFAAARFPDCTVDLKVEFPKLQLRYKQRSFESGTRRFRAQIDEIPLHERRRTDSMLVSADAEEAPELTRDDVPYMIRVVAEPIDEWRDRIIPYHDVLTADEMQLRRWFSGKAIVVGQMIPPRDQWPTRSGDLIFGCQIHAQAIDQLLGEQFNSRYFWPELRWRTLLWAAAAGLAVTARQPQHTPSLRGLLLGCGLAIATGLCGAVYVAMALTQPWQVEIGIALTTLLVAFGAAYLLKGLRLRQLELAPPDAAVPVDQADLPSTVLAPTR